MKKSIFILIFFAFINTAFTSAEATTITKYSESQSPYGKKKNFKKMKAYFRYRDADYNGALRILREIYEKNPADAKTNYMMGKCYVQLQEMDKAISFLNKSISLKADIDNDVHYYLGQAYQYQGKLDSAITEYTTYKSSLKQEKLKYDPVVDLLEQTQTAKNLMAHPVNVTIKNLGAEINSEYDDAMPSITADGKTLIFTSRRPDTKGGAIDPNTGQYYDDIYIATWNDEKNKWSSSEDAEGELNTAGHDACLSISPDGSIIFVYRNIAKVTGSGDIYYSVKRPDGKWSNPKNIDKPINTSFFESSACLSPDGNTLYFISERNGGNGNADIWKSKKLGKNLWAKPENLGPVINTIEDELGVYIHPDGKTLFFTSKGHNSMGGYDVFMSRMNPDSTWSVPVNLGYPINSTKDELSFVLTTDGKKAYISSRKENGLGGADIYEIDMTKYFYPIGIDGKVEENIVETELSILKGTVIESNSAQQTEAEIVIKDVATGKETKIESDDNGDYFVTLKGNKDYEISVAKEGYKKYSEKVTLPYDKTKTYTLVKLIVLEKLPEEKKE
ncbi:MAG TPA: tetratricopeptide repeat protein [Bacteroidales bacterium]|nr:tetratricopeptide repeat protein [Bacteroidales bacterium]HPS18354.1 tetratricopeptide repeat protein [Bacteroidales bacterium]